MPLVDGKFFYLHIPKTAGTTVEYVLGLHGLNSVSFRNFSSRFFTFMAGKSGKERIESCYGHVALPITPQHLTLNEMVSLGLVSLSDVFDRLVCFTVVRNPYSRVVSQWRSHGRSERYENVNDFVSQWLFNPGQRKDQNDMAHSRPQSDFLELSGFYSGIRRGEPNIEIIRFEDLSTALPDFLKRHGWSARCIPHKNKGGMTVSYRDLLSSDSRRLIEEMYHKDFESFGYEW